jgi:hypothetical protein
MSRIPVQSLSFLAPHWPQSEHAYSDSNVKFGLSPDSLLSRWIQWFNLLQKPSPRGHGWFLAASPTPRRIRDTGRGRPHMKNCVWRTVLADQNYTISTVSYQLTCIISLVWTCIFSRRRCLPAQFQEQLWPRLTCYAEMLLRFRPNHVWRIWLCRWKKAKTEAL